MNFTWRQQTSFEPIFESFKIAHHAIGQDGYSYLGIVEFKETERPILIYTLIDGGNITQECDSFEAAFKTANEILLTKFELIEPKFFQGQLEPMQ